MSDNEKKSEADAQQSVPASLTRSRELAQVLRDQQLTRKPNTKMVGKCEPFLLKK